MPKQKLKQRKDGRYCCDRNGIRFYGKTQSEALQKRAEYDAQIAQGLRHEQVGIGISEYADRWLSAYRSTSCTKSQKLYRKILDELVDFVGDCRLSDITPTDIKLFYAGLQKYSATHISKYKATIGGLFRSACNDRIILRNPAADASPPQGSAGTHRPLEPWERDAVHQLVDHRFGIAAMVMLYAGLRRGEVLALDLDRDLVDGRLFVREAVTYSDTHRGSAKSPKTASGERSIPLIEPLKSLLQGRHGKVFQPKCEAATESAFRRAWESYKRAFEKLTGKPCTIRTHDFRHSFCTMLFDASIDMKTAMSWMGHSDDTMIRRIYDHLTTIRERSAEKNLAETVEKMLSNVQLDVQDC